MAQSRSVVAVTLLTAFAGFGLASREGFVFGSLPELLDPLNGNTI